MRAQAYVHPRVPEKILTATDGDITLCEWCKYDKVRMSGPGV